MKWNDSKVRDWLYEVGMELIEVNLYTEGGELIFYAKFHTKPIDQKTFVKIIKKVCEWEDEDIQEAILEIKELTAFT